MGLRDVVEVEQAPRDVLRPIGEHGQSDRRLVDGLRGQDSFGWIVLVHLQASLLPAKEKEHYNYKGIPCLKSSNGILALQVPGFNILKTNSTHCVFNQTKKI